MQVLSGRVEEVLTVTHLAPAVQQVFADACRVFSCARWSFHAGNDAVQIPQGSEDLSVLLERRRVCVLITLHRRISMLA